MLKSVIAIIVVLIATVLFPVWVQLLLYCIACVVMRYRILLLIPALFADTLYAPTNTQLLAGHRYAFFVVFLLIITWIVVRFTRLGQRDNDTTF